MQASCSFARAMVQGYYPLHRALVRPRQLRRTRSFMQATAGGCPKRKRQQASCSPSLSLSFSDFSPSLSLSLAVAVHVASIDDNSEDIMSAGYPYVSENFGPDAVMVHQTQTPLSPARGLPECRDLRYPGPRVRDAGTYDGLVQHTPGTCTASLPTQRFRYTDPSAHTSITIDTISSDGAYLP